MLSPTWAFGVPALAALGLSTAVMLVALAYLLGIFTGETPFGASWTIAAGFLFTIGHLAAIMAAATHLHGVRSGYRQLRPVFQRWSGILTLETMIITGCGLIVLALLAFVGIAAYWSHASFTALPSTLPLVLAAVAGTTGAQNIFGGFLLSVIAGHDARLMAAPIAAPTLTAEGL